MQNDPTAINPDRWRQIETLYNSALQLDVAGREAFVNGACAGDEVVRRELLSLLSAAECEDSFLEEPALNLGLSVLGEQHETLTGEFVDRYHLLELLGRGGMGEVYLAHDPRLNRRVALKLLPSDLTDDRDRVRRFEQEAQIASRISHPNVGHIYEIGEAQGRHYITMEYIAGKTLRRMVKQGAMETSHALDIAIQVLTAVAAAHAAGIIHRDIKPENVMLCDDGFVKVLDFGLAKLSEHKDSEANVETETVSSSPPEPKLLMGTSGYMSPEQIRGQSIDQRTDLWSVGVMIYEMLTGRRPFPGKTFSEMIIAVLEHEPARLADQRPELPLMWQAFIEKALRKQVDARYQTAATMLADLRQLRHQLETNGMSGGGSNGETVERLKHPLADPTSATSQLFKSATDELGVFKSFSAYFNSLRTHLPIQTIPLFSLKDWRLPKAITLLLLVGGGLYLGLFSRHQLKLQEKSFNLQFERLNLSGNLTDLILSPDGKYVASVVGEAGKQAIHIMDLATTTDRRITEPSGTGYSGLAFSPDGNYLYYIKNQSATGTLYRISKLGDDQRKILSHLNTPVTFAPDGTRMAFIRVNIPDDTPDLMIAAVDGTVEQTLTRRTRRDVDFFPVNMNGAGPAWSPDGKWLACPTINRTHRPQQMNVEIFDATTGASHRLNATPWADVSRIAWLADGSGLIIAAAESPAGPWQIRSLAYPEGTIRKVTSDANNYTRISATSDSKILLTLNTEENSGIWLTAPRVEQPFSPLNVSEQKGASDVVWSPVGKLIYTVKDGASINLWLKESDGKAARQLTSERSKNYRPAVSPDGRYIIFVSLRTGASNLWRINMDGTDPRQLTSGTYDDMPTMTPDGQWIIYRTATGVWKVSMDGGSPIKLFDKTALFPVVSPDGKSLAYLTNERADSPQWFVEVVDLESLGQLKRIALPETVKPYSGLQWMPDNQSVVYVGSASGAANLWVQSLAGTAPPPQRLTDFKDADILSFTVAKDGRQIACVRNAKTYIPVLLKLF